MNLNSEEDQSSIAQQNIINLKQSLAKRFLTYNDMKILQSQPPKKTNQSHQYCKSFALNWNRYIDNNFQRLIPLSNQQNQKFINQPLLSCCLDTKLSLTFRLKKHSNIQIVKYAKIGNKLQQNGVRYMIENSVSTTRIQTSITNNGISKIWKQIEVPVASFEPQPTYTVEILERTNGDIQLTLNDFQFMMDFNDLQADPKYFGFRGEGTIQSFALEQLAQNSNNKNYGCSQDQCSIF